MVLYEVTLSFPKEILSKIETWLPSHAQELMELGLFQSVHFFKTEALPSSEKLQFVVHYFCASRKELEEYFTTHALIMREKTQQTFGDSISATRRVLESLDLTS